MIELKNLEKISFAAGNRIDYVQGGGGNTSVKLDDERMAVKASGFKLKQINEKEGYVVVNYKKIKEFYENVNLDEDRDYEKESTDYVKSNIIDMDGLKKLRPSVEAGFHSILKKYVIHSHPVYANILCCSQQGKELVETIFSDMEYAAAWIPYINPGFCLTLKIKDQINSSLKSDGRFPQVIFMENHGLIVTDDDSDRCISLHEEVNERIRSYLRLKEKFPEVIIDKLGENDYISKNKFVSSFFRENKPGLEYFDKTVLYPDQLVYLNGSIRIDDEESKANINTGTGEILYKTSLSEAQTIEETLLAYLYVINGIKESGLSIKTMSDKEIDFIRNWESEAYRKSLVKELNK